MCRIGSVLECRPRDARIVEPVNGRQTVHVRECTERGVVAVDDERRLCVQCGDGGTPAPGDELELAVAVELVAKQVAETDGARPQAPQHLRQRALVDLEQPELGAVGCEQGGGDAGDEVRAGAVVREPEPAAQDLGRHRSGGRLAVRGGDERAPGGQPRGQPVDRAGIELRQELARHGRAAARTGEARQCSDAACRGDLGGQRDADLHARRVIVREAPSNGDGRSFLPHHSNE